MEWTFFAGRDSEALAQQLDFLPADQHIVTMTTLAEDLEPVRELIRTGNLRGAAARVAAYAILKPEFARLAQQAVPRMVFNHHAPFKVLGSRLSAWPKHSRDSWATQIGRAADQPERLPGIVDLALQAATEAIDQPR